jgi:hypothetical protein
VDLTPEIRMIVARWAPSHDPWAHQFVRGKVDRRIIPKIAEFFATVNLENYGDPQLNDGIKNTFRAIYPMCKGAFAQMIGGDGEPPDHFIAFAREMGQERFDDIIDAMAEAYEKCEFLVHGDAHALNILVEPMSNEEEFGKKEDFFVCDWEMCHNGSKGRDPGTFHAWPICCAYFLAARGEKQKAYDLVDCVQEFWGGYAQHMVAKGKKDDAFMLELYRDCLGWAGVYAFIANYLLKLQTSYLPFDLVSPEAGAKVMASTALTGLKLLEYGFMNVEPELTITQLRAWLTDLVRSQINLLLGLCKDL